MLTKYQKRIKAFIGLVDQHAYAVLDLRKFEDKRLLLLKNPWTHLRWKGRYSEKDQKSWTPELCKALDYNPQDAQVRVNLPDTANNTVNNTTNVCLFLPATVSMAVSERGLLHLAIRRRSLLGNTCFAS